MTDILVLGSDGYTGWPLTCRLLENGYDVFGIDNLTRRDRTTSVTPIQSHSKRATVANEAFDGDYEFRVGDTRSYEAIATLLEAEEPDTVVNLAQIPAAPYSMGSPARAWEVQQNNVRGALNLYWAIQRLDIPTPHVVQLATMGEYGTPESGIPEGFLEDGRPAPKEPGSFYHASKVAATVNTLFAARTWDIPTTEIYQGIVYGVSPYHDLDAALGTRFDVDETWGTVLNRFTAQAAADQPLTVYGAGGQKRAMLSLSDCVQCLELAIENPPARWDDRYPYRAINQFDEAHRVRDLADMVHSFTGAEIAFVENPRAEDDSDHDYDPEREILDELGYEPTRSIEDEFRRAFAVVEEHVDRIDDEALWPSTSWTPDPVQSPAEADNPTPEAD